MFLSSFTTHSQTPFRHARPTLKELVESTTPPTMGLPGPDLASIQHDLRERLLEDTTAPMLLYIYYLYMLECLIYGVGKTTIVPDIGCHDGVATFYKFIIYVLGDTELCRYYSPLIEDELRNQLDTLEPSWDFVVCFGRNTKKYSGPREQSASTRTYRSS